MIVKIIENKTMYIVQELHLCIFSMKLHSMELHSAFFTSSTFSVHSSISLSTNSFQNLQFT